MPSSFFEDDDDPVEPPKKKLHRGDGRKRPPLTNPPPSTAAPLQEDAALRFSISSNDVSAAELRRLQEMSNGGISRPTLATSGCGTDALGDSLAKSMEAARERREREKDDALIRKVKKEREEEAIHNPELVEKDLMVGVYITDAYKAKVMAQLRHHSSAAGTNEAIYSEEDDVHFSSSMVSVTSTKLYDGLHGNNNVVGSRGDVPTFEHRSENESRDIADVPLAGGDSIQPSEKPISNEDVAEPSKSAVEAAEQQAHAAKAAAREARRQRQVDDIMLSAMQKRFLERQQKNLELHLKCV